MRRTALDHWTLNLLLPVGRDVISPSGIKKKNTHIHTKGVVVCFFIFSVWFSRVTARVNRLFEASENWISEAALLFYFFSSSSARVKSPPPTGKGAAQINAFNYSGMNFSIITVSWINPSRAGSQAPSQPSLLLSHLHVKQQRFKTTQMKLMACFLFCFPPQITATVPWRQRCPIHPFRAPLSPPSDTPRTMANSTEEMVSGDNVRYCWTLRSHAPSPPAAPAATSEH